jgi:SAM-dependent methyltransferase
MTIPTDQLKQEWDKRSKRLGSTQRAVLFKRFPGCLNQLIHRRHVDFVVRNCPEHVASVLDVGCGYGRLSVELARRTPQIRFQGVDLCTEFAMEYERQLGACFDGPIQEFRSDDQFELVLIVTTLMYLDETEHRQVLQRIWQLLPPGGRIICIEPASELFLLWRQLTGRESASPTGGSVEHFTLSRLLDTFSCLKNGRLVDTFSVRLFPFIKATAVHHGIAIEKPVTKRETHHERRL